MAPNNTPFPVEAGKVRLLVARHVLPAFFLLAQNHYQRRAISAADLALFIQEYSHDAMTDLLMSPCFNSPDFIDEALFIAKCVGPENLPILSAHLEAVDIEVIKQDALKLFVW
jgi:hypothetical protein